MGKLLMFKLRNAIFFGKIKQVFNVYIWILTLSGCMLYVAVEWRVYNYVLLKSMLQPVCTRGEL